MELNAKLKAKTFRIKSIISALLSTTLILVTGCTTEETSLGAPNVSFYVLDLTGSGNVDSQFNRIEVELNRSINIGPFGNPFPEEGEIKSPETLKFSFIGTNSRFLESFELVDIREIYALFDEVVKDSRKKVIWGQLKKFYQQYLNDYSLSVEEKRSVINCRQYFEREMAGFFNAQSSRDFYASELCEIAVPNLGLLNDLKMYIESQKGRQRASDVFGALQVVEREANTILRSFPKAEIKVFLATDGDHKYGKNQVDNLRNRILESSDVCQLAEQIASELEIETLRSEKVQLSARGLGALESSIGRYPAQLDSFWRCFFNE